MDVSRKKRKHIRKTDAAATRMRNGAVKAKERRRRDDRIIGKLRAGSLPFAPPVMSWLSQRLNKKAARITPEEIKNVLT